jgi:uncharacterized protein YegP (UPF0339 family)
MAIFVTSERANGEFQFVLRADNGSALLMSEGYTTSSARDNGIESVRNNSTDEGRYAPMESSNGKFYFNLKAGNGQVIGSSPMFESAAARQEAMSSVMGEAAQAKVEAQ